MNSGADWDSIIKMKYFQKLSEIFVPKPTLTRINYAAIKLLVKSYLMQVTGYAEKCESLGSKSSL